MRFQGIFKPLALHRLGSSALMFACFLMLLTKCSTSVLAVHVFDDSETEDQKDTSNLFPLEDESLFGHVTPGSKLRLTIPDLDVYSKETSEACAVAKSVPIGCSIYKACHDDNSDKGYCAPQSVWNDVCSDDIDLLRRDGVCEKYQDRCIESTSEECLSGLPNLPKTSEIRSLIKEMCLEMPKMKACSHCRTGDCADPFISAYIPLCVSMPGMHECQRWRAMCGQVKDSPIKTAWRCGAKAEDPDPPPMRMYLHLSTLDYLLFSWWVPRTTASYVLACLTCFFLGAFSSWTRIVRVRLEGEWTQMDEEILQGDPLWFSAPSYALNFRRGVLVAVVSALDFAVMLLVMTFNVGIITSCITGLAFGHFAFGHMARRAVPTCCSAAD